MGPVVRLAALLLALAAPVLAQPSTTPTQANAELATLRTLDDQLATWEASSTAHLDSRVRGHLRRARIQARLVGAHLLSSRDGAPVSSWTERLRLEDVGLGEGSSQLSAAQAASAITALDSLRTEVVAWRDSVEAHDFAGGGAHLREAVAELALVRQHLVAIRDGDPELDHRPISGP